MDLFKNLSKFLVIFSIAIFAVSCGDDDEPTTSGDPTIAELASDTDNLSILVAALDRADLVSTLNGDGPFTVFAPTNEAFENFLATNGFNSLEDIPVDVLSSVLLNHVVSGSVSSSQLTTGYIETAATEATSGNNINMYVNTTNGVTLNGTSQVTQADIAADNGIVHVVNEVIGLPSVVTFATADNTFSTLVAALTRSDLTTDFVSVLSGAGPFTVFAPTNDAFTALVGELGISGLGDIDTGTLDAVLKYHVVGGANVVSTMLSDDMDVETLANVGFSIDLDNGAEIVDNRGRRISIIVTDVQASNGVIHAVDRVILP